MDAAQAIALVSDLVRSQGLEYPIGGLVADRFEVGWSVYAPVDIDDSDPMAFAEVPVGRSVFLVGDSGRIEEVSTSVPPRLARERFIAQEAANLPTDRRADEFAFMAELQREFTQLSADDPPISEFTILAGAPDDISEDSSGSDASDEAGIAAHASSLLDPIVQQLAQLGPPGWDRFSAAFAFTVSAEIAQLRFWTEDGHAGLVPVPASIAELVREQRDVTAAMPAGPWWRLLLTVTDSGEMSADYDYGDQPFPDDQLLAPEHYRDDLDAYPRSWLPLWLAGYVAGPEAQGRDAHRAKVAAAADADAGHSGVPIDDIPPLPELWSRWAVLSATHVGVQSDWGPRMFPATAWYESDHRSGSTLYVLPGDRAVCSGGKWDSALLDAAYNGGRPLPSLYTGAPAWVNDTVLNARHRNGLLSYCLWWANGDWCHGAANPVDELGEALPPVLRAEDTLNAMVSQTGPGTEDSCRALLTAAANRTATHHDVAAILTNHANADIDAALNQLSLAGLLAP